MLVRERSKLGLNLSDAEIATVAVDNSITEGQRLDHLVQSTTCKTDTSKILQGLAASIDLYTKGTRRLNTLTKKNEYQVSSLPDGKCVQECHTIYLSSKEGLHHPVTASRRFNSDVRDELGRVANDSNPTSFKVSNT